MAAPVLYATVEEVKLAQEIRATARIDAQVYRAIDSVSRTIERVMHRRFYPELDTRTFDWPNDQYANSWRLWLDKHELASASGVTMTVAGNSVSSLDYFLRPDEGPPFTHVEIDLSGPAAFGAGDTHQRSISITGLFGYDNNEVTAGALAEALDTSETAIDVTDSEAIGIGSVVRVDSERMIVTGKTQLTSGQTLQTNLSASQANVTVAVTTGSAFIAGEVVLLDSERMLVVDISGNNLTVKRAWDGTVLATHAGSTIYVQRTLAVERGALGTTAATHSTAAPILRHVIPGPVRMLALGLSLFTVHQEQIGYGSTTGGQLGQSTRETKGTVLKELWETAYGAVGRKARVRAA
jgi:hypothetical protein